jgi:hypothetical protein
MLTLSDEEVEELMWFFMNCGYISHEFHPQVHTIIKKLQNHIKEKTEITTGEDEDATL